MTAFEILIQEHRLIKQFLAVLGSMLDSLDRGAKPNPDDLQTAIRFIQEYADSFHHAKEETILFRELEAVGVEDELDQIGNLESEHFFGRTFCSGMDEALEQIRAGQADSLSAFTDNGRAYIALLVQHICKEDKQFFPWCEKQLDSDATDKLRRLFEKTASTDFDPGLNQKWTAWVAQLKEKYGESAEVLKACH